MAMVNGKMVDASKGRVMCTRSSFGTGSTARFAVRFLVPFGFVWTEERPTYEAAAADLAALRAAVAS